MPPLALVERPKTRAGKRFLENRAPKLEENSKNSMFIRGTTADTYLMSALRDLVKLKQPNAIFFNKKNDIKPFEDVIPLETFAAKNDASLFMFASHNKKRPHNIVFGRLFDKTVLDMAEFGLENFKALSEFQGPKIVSGTKPMLIFSGEAFDNELSRVKNLLLDFFRGPQIEAVRLQGLEHVIQFTAHENKINLRSYRVLLKKSGTPVPRIELQEMGPRMDLKLRRTKFASDNFFKLACKQTKINKIKKTKNLKPNVFGSKMGRIHMERQDYKRLQTKKFKGLKKTFPGKKVMVDKKDNPRSKGAKDVKVVKTKKIRKEVSFELPSS